MITPKKLQELYMQGENITQRLRREKACSYNTAEIIEIAYDMQTGSYIKAMESGGLSECKKTYAAQIAKTITSLYAPHSVLEAGVGEATTLADVLQNLDSPVNSFGFDLSWSRVAYAKQWLQEKGFHDTALCTGDLRHIPFADNAIDIVYTSHAIEPNGGSEKSILQELYRVARKFLLLIEPGYEFANEASRKRMESLGYCKNLKGTAETLGYKVLRHELFSPIVNPLNPSALTIIQKSAVSEPPSDILACPKYKTPLEKIENALFSPEALAVYPIVGDIPCLRVENSIFASKFKEVMPPH